MNEQEVREFEENIVKGANLLSYRYTYTKRGDVSFKDMSPLFGFIEKGT